MSRGFSITILCAVLFSTLLCSDSSAIVIRHDRDDADYRQRGEKFDAVVLIHPAETGTLIDRRTVMTAAHVADGIAGKTSPRVEVDGAEYRVTRIFLHPEWSGRGTHDVALLRLDQSVRNVDPARLFRQDDEKGMQILLVGYGDSGTGLTGPEFKDDIKRAASNRVDDVDKNWLYFAFNAPGEGATDWEGVSGPGDSGGPALIEENGNLLVLGVSAYSFEGKPGRYGTREAYTRVSTHASWIEEVLAGNLEDSGFAPGRNARGGRSVTRSKAPGPDLGEVPGGALVVAYLEAYNSRDDAAMQEFIQANFSSAYRQRQPMGDMLAWYGRMLSQHFGSLTADGVVDASDKKFIVRISGDNKQQGELHITWSADNKIDDLIAAIIEEGP